MAGYKALPGSDYLQFETLAQGGKRSGDGVDPCIVAKVEQSRHLGAREVETPRKIGGTYILVEHFIVQQNRGRDAGRKIDGMGSGHKMFGQRNRTRSLELPRHK